MARTTPQKVKDILEDVSNEAVLASFIDAANSIVDAIYDCDQADDKVLSATNLTLIETWLAAHFYHVMDLRVKETQTGKSKDIYQGETGKFLDSTGYGQTAISLDISGCLAKFNKEAYSGGKIQIGLEWLGTSYD